MSNMDKATYIGLVNLIALLVRCNSDEKNLKDLNFGLQVKPLESSIVRY